MGAHYTQQHTTHNNALHTTAPTTAHNSTQQHTTHNSTLHTTTDSTHSTQHNIQTTHNTHNTHNTQHNVTHHPPPHFVTCVLSECSQPAGVCIYRCFHVAFCVSVDQENIKVSCLNVWLLIMLLFVVLCYCLLFLFVLSLLFVFFVLFCFVLFVTFTE